MVANAKLFTAQSETNAQDGHASELLRLTLSIAAMHPMESMTVTSRLPA